MGKKSPQPSAEPPPPVNLARKTWLPWNGSEQRLKSLLRSLLEAKHISLTELARLLEKPPAHVSRWLKDLEGEHDQLPLGVLFQIARILDHVVVIGLVEGRKERDGKLHLPTPPLLREFFLGMGCSVNPAEGPRAVARHIAEVFGAKSWSMYTEDLRRNVLEWAGGGPRLANPELMSGPSFASELPIQVLQDTEMSRWSPTADDATAPKSFVERDWDEEKRRSDQRSSFAERERVAYCMGIPVQGEDLRTTVLFLNFDKKPPAAVRDPDVVATAANELRGLVQQAWPTPKPTGTMQRGDLAFARVLEVLSPAFAFADGDALDAQTQEALQNSCQALWPGKEKQCTVYALSQSVRYLDKNKPALHFGDGVEPDGMVRRAAGEGENFWVPDLAQDEVRARFDADNRIPRRQVQKLVVPIRAEDFLAAGAAARHAIWRAEAKDSQRVLQVHAPHKSQVRSWGAVSVDTAERILLQANSLELSVLAHLTAGAFAIRRRAAAKGAPRSFYEPLFNAIHATIGHWRQLDEQRGSTAASGTDAPAGGADRQLDPLDLLCQAVVESRLLDGVERCAIYPYDHVHGLFRKGGSHIDKDWTVVLKRELPMLVAKGKVKYLEPRKGGNSERMLGLVDEYHIISDARNHPRVSPVTKMMGTASLIGCSCRIGCSLRSDAVLWLGSRKTFAPDYLEAKDHAMLERLRVLAQVAAMFCVALRWWGPGDWPTPGYRT